MEMTSHDPQIHRCSNASNEQRTEMNSWSNVSRRPRATGSGGWGGRVTTPYCLSKRLSKLSSHFTLGDGDVPDVMQPIGASRCRSESEAWWAGPPWHTPPIMIHPRITPRLQWLTTHLPDIDPNSQNQRHFDRHFDTCMNYGTALPRSLAPAGGHGTTDPGGSPPRRPSPRPTGEPNRGSSTIIARAGCIPTPASRSYHGKVIVGLTGLARPQHHWPSARLDDGPLAGTSIIHRPLVSST